MQSINEIKAETPGLTSEAEEIEALYQIAEEYGVDVPQDDIVNKDMVVGGAQMTQQCLRDTFLEAITHATDFKINNLKVRI